MKRMSGSTKAEESLCVDSQSPAINTEMLWKDLKGAVHVRKPTNMSELKLFCGNKNFTFKQT